MNPGRRTSLLFILVGLLAASVVPVAVDAAVIRLKNGNTLHGEVEIVNEQEVTIEIPGAGKLTLSRDEIASIEGLTSKEQAEEREEPVQLEPLEETEAIQLPATTRDEARSMEETIAQEPELETKAPTSTTEGRVFEAPTLQSTAEIQAETPGAEHVPKTVDVLKLLWRLLFFLYYALCLFLIARKTGTPHAWLAWVPVLNLVLACWIVGWSLWWFVGLMVALLLLGLMQASGLTLLIIVAVFFIWLMWCVRVAQARGKPWWVGVHTGDMGDSLYRRHG